MNTREQNVSVGGHIIREKTLGFTKEFDIADFKASDGQIGGKTDIMQYFELFLMRKVMHS